HAATTRPSTADAATATSAGHPGVVKPNARHGNADSSSSPWEGEHVELLPSSVGRSTPNNAPGTTTSTTTSTAAGGRSAGEGARSRRSSSSSQGSSSSSSRGGSRGCSRERAGYGGRREGEWATLSGLEAVHSCNSWETFSPPRLALFPVDHHSGAASPRLSSPWPVRLSTSLNTSPHPFLPSSASPFQAALGAAARHQRNPSLQLLQSPLKGLQRLQGQQAERLRMLQSTPVHKLTASPIQMVEAASPLPLLQHAEATLTQFDALLLDDKPPSFLRRTPTHQHPAAAAAAGKSACSVSATPAVPLVDDNMVNRKVMSKMLQRYGVEVEAVDGGAKAVAAVTKADAAAAAPYDCVFMDLQMPGMDGLEATGLIRKHEAEQQAQAQAASAQHDGTAAGGKRRLLVIALTADVGAGTKEKCVDAGMDGYMTKPIEEDQLSRILLPFLN
ncbi:hypothetical protein CLOM_g24364, partial [Closterium sp. NIES-68]